MDHDVIKLPIILSNHLFSLLETGAGLLLVIEQLMWC